MCRHMPLNNFLVLEDSAANRTSLIGVLLIFGFRPKSGNRRSVGVSEKIAPLTTRPWDARWDGDGLMEITNPIVASLD